MIAGNSKSLIWSLVWPVRRETETLALKMTVASPTSTREAAGLLAWDGHGMVKLHRYDADVGAALLQMAGR